MRVGSECQFGDTVVQVEQGSSLACSAVLPALQGFRDAYQERFGRVDLGGRAIRVRNTGDLRTTGLSMDTGIGGETYADAIDLAGTCLECLPHEMNHARKGPGHSGWCLDFAPWTRDVLGWNQDAYLGCKE